MNCVCACVQGWLGIVLSGTYFLLPLLVPCPFHRRPEQSLLKFVNFHSELDKVSELQNLVEDGRAVDSSAAYTSGDMLDVSERELPGAFQSLLRWVMMIRWI